METSYERKEGDGYDWSAVHRDKVDKNKCAKYKSGDCKLDPCSNRCPVMKCEITDASKVNEGEGYVCVEDTTTSGSATTSSAPSGSATTLSAQGGSSKLTEDWHGDLMCECVKKVAQKENPWTWCPSLNKGGCCPPEKPKCCSNVSNPEYDASSKASMCCDAGQGCAYSKLKQSFACKAGDDCPPETPNKCPPNPGPNDFITTCCADGKECKFYSTPEGNIYYCGDPGCKPGDAGYCGASGSDTGICCSPDQDCVNFMKILFWCNAKKEDCTGSGKTYCEGHTMPKIILCCQGSTPNCLINPNGAPSCY